MNSDNISIPERLKVLERKYKSVQIISFSVILVLGALLFIGAAKKEEISDLLLAKELQIVDEAGNKRIRIGKADAGYGVVIFDEHGSFNATLTDAPGGAAIQLRKEGGSIKLLAVDQGRSITFRNGKGEPTTILIENRKLENGNPQLILQKGEDKKVISLSPTD
jgi:hypothetical protein